MLSPHKGRRQPKSRSRRPKHPSNGFCLMQPKTLTTCPLPPPNTFLLTSPVLSNASDRLPRHSKLIREYSLPASHLQLPPLLNAFWRTTGPWIKRRAFTLRHLPRHPSLLKLYAHCPRTCRRPTRFSLPPQPCSTSLML